MKQVHSGALSHVHGALCCLEGGRMPFLTPRNQVMPGNGRNSLGLLQKLLSKAHYAQALQTAADIQCTVIETTEKRFHNKLIVFEGGSENQAAASTSYTALDRRSVSPFVCHCSCWKPSPFVYQA